MRFPAVNYVHISFFMLGRNLVFIDHVIPKIRELKVVALLVLKTFWFDELLPGYDISDIV